MPELTFEDLRCHYQNGRALLISGEGRNRVYGYRTGVQCKLGDIERDEWIRMVKDAIQSAGEKMLYEELLQHLKDHNYTGDSRAELEFKALELHASRIFDDELWVDYLQFNLKFRPEVIDPTRLVLVMPDCCKKAGQLTWARFEENREYNCCPHCGRWTEIRLLEEG